MNFSFFFGGILPWPLFDLGLCLKSTGKMQPGVTLRDLVHAIPYYAIQQAPRKPLFFMRCIDFRCFFIRHVSMYFDSDCLCFFFHNSRCFPRVETVFQLFPDFGSGPPDSGEEGQEEHLQWPYFGD